MRQIVGLLLRVRARFFPRTEFASLPVIGRIIPRLLGAATCEFVDDVHGHRIHLDDRDSLGLSTSRNFEPTETAFFDAQIGAGANVIDVGANIGYYTLLFAKKVGPEGRVFAFEPDPRNFELLTENVTLNGYQNVEARQVAVADTIGGVQLFISPTNRMDHRIYDTGEEREVITVPTVTLDEYFRSAPISIHWIKMDIQGAELRALRGMRKLIRANPSLALVTEYWPFGLARAGHDPIQYLIELDSLGFSFLEINEAAGNLRPASREALASLDPSDKWVSTNLICRRD